MSLFDTQFHYTPDERDKIAQLRQLIERDPNLHVGSEDVFYSKFLSSADWNEEKAFKRIQHYYDFKTRNPNWMIKESLEYYRNLYFDTQCRFIMPHPDKNGRAIMVFTTVDAFDKYPNYFYDLVQIDDMFYEALLLLPQVQRYGLTILHDLNGTTKNFIRVLSPQNARIVNEKNDVMPFKMRVTHAIQKSAIMNTALNMVMPFMSRDFKERYITHDGKNFDKLRKLVGYECLPASLGGPPENVYDAEFSFGLLERNAEYLAKLREYKLVKQ